MSRRSIHALVALTMAGAACSASATNLITNGGFEAPAVPAGGYTIYGAGGDIGGWTVTGSSVLTLATDYAEPGVTFPAHSGLVSLDITGAGNTGNGGVQQSLTLAVGAQYRLSFWLANTDGGGNVNYPVDSSVRVSITGVADTIFTDGDTTLTGTSNWKQGSIDFTATSASTVIGFVNNTAFADNAALLDDIALVQLPAVPEPGTWAMLVAGLGLLAAATRRQR